MRRYITETLDQAKYLISLSLKKGMEGFVPELKRYAAFIAETYPGEHKEINHRFLALISGLLAIFFEGQTERIIRSQLQLSENFINEPSIDKKSELFIQEVALFVEKQIQFSAAIQLSSQAALYLKMCSVRELRETTVTTLAEYFGYHPDYFSKKIKSETGSLPSDLILAEKIRRATVLIKGKTGRKNLKEIAQSLGFQDYPHFRRLLKKHLGATPSQL